MQSAQSRAIKYFEQHPEEWEEFLMDGGKVCPKVFIPSSEQGKELYDRYVSDLRAKDRQTEESKDQDTGARSSTDSKSHTKSRRNRR
jgi:hypothetical protein